MAPAGSWWPPVTPTANAAPSRQRPAATPVVVMAPAPAASTRPVLPVAGRPARTTCSARRRAATVKAPASGPRRSAASDSAARTKAARNRAPATSSASTAPTATLANASTVNPADPAPATANASSAWSVSSVSACRSGQGGWMTSSGLFVPSFESNEVGVSSFGMSCFSAKLTAVAFAFLWACT